MSRRNREHSPALADFSVDTRILIIILLAAFVGAVSTLIARLLVLLIGLISNLVFYQRLSAELLTVSHHALGPLVILAPAAGGLCIGVMARYGSEKIRGHGIPEALEAILIGSSRMSLKVALLKPLSSAISIGTGGPFGAEGPIIMTGGAFGSIFAQRFRLSAAERKTLLVAGAAAGMCAIFNTPVAAALLAVELLLFEWRPRSLIPVAAASTVAAAMRSFCFDSGPLFAVHAHPVLPWIAIVSGVVLGLGAGLCSGILTALVYGFEDFFERVPLHWMWWPACGGIVVGLGGYLDPRVLGVGYDSLQGLLGGDILGRSALTLLALKALVWSFSLGSGTSGGVLAPLLLIGGALGALASPAMPVGDASLWSLAGMAAMMGGSMRSPFTAIVFALELTHDVAALPVLFAATIASDAVTVLMLRRSILTEKVSRRGHHISRDYSVDPFDMLRVCDVMDTTVAAVSMDLTVSQLCAQIASGDPLLRRHQAIALVDTQKELAGIVTRGDIIRAVEKSGQTPTPLRDVAATRVIVVTPDELLREAVEKMLRNKIGRLLVVSREHPRRVVGYLGRGELMNARMGRIDEESYGSGGSLRREGSEIRPDLS